MKFDIKTFYTEKLNITNHIDVLDNDTNIKMNINMKGVFQDTDKWDDCVLFKVYYDVESEKAPISLNWVGVFVLKFINQLDNYDVNVEEIFYDENIKQILNEFIKQFSLNLRGELPYF